MNLNFPNITYNFTDTLNGNIIFVLAHDKPSLDALLEKYAIAIDYKNFIPKSDKTYYCNDELGRRIIIIGIQASDNVSEKNNIGVKLHHYAYGYASNIILGEIRNCGNQNFDENFDIISQSDQHYILYSIMHYSWSYNDCKSHHDENASSKKGIQAHLSIITDTQDIDQEEEKYNKHFNQAIRAQCFARYLVTSPSNLIGTREIIDYVKQYIDQENLNIDVKVLDKGDLQDLSAGGILGVARGSSDEQAPYMLILEYKGNPNSEKYYGLVGKGVVYDTGGISLKPSRAMEDMKCDMSGAAATIGAIFAAANSGVKKNIVAVMPIVRNDISAFAIKPGDVITMLNGKTVEVNNTDAEGRLILADALHYTQEHYELHHLVNIATLTGNMMLVFGDLYAGLFARNQSLADALINTGQLSNERVWQLPIDSDFRLPTLHSIADISNVLNKPGPGSSQAASFLEYFIDKNVDWAHIDMAGMAWNRGKEKICASGYGVLLLYNWLMQ